MSLRSSLLKCGPMELMTECDRERARKSGQQFIAVDRTHGLHGNMAVSSCSG